jgi:hypothetical protein
MLREDPLSTGILDMFFRKYCIGQFPLIATFSERVAEVRNSPKFFKILRILLKYYHIIMTMGGGFPLVLCADMEIYHWEGQTLCPRTDLFELAASV